MKIREYFYRDVDEPGWEFAKVEFGMMNLLVGNTATGKSRFLNTMFNLGRFVAAKEFRNGYWDIIFEHAGVAYSWNLETEKREEDEDEPGVVVRENLRRIDSESSGPIVERTQEVFRFNGAELPKLSPTETSLSILHDEEVRPIHDAFTFIQRRLFSHDALSKAAELQALPIKQTQRMGEAADLGKLFHANFNLNIKLYVLSKYFKDTYALIVDKYREIFPFLQEGRMTDVASIRPNVPIGGYFPVFCVRERNSDKWVLLNDLSSGMLKVLLIITDLTIIPSEGVYIIEEYENSLGVNAIDFFPQFALELEKRVQFFITSHHPYIINQIPIQDWYVFHRAGMKVSIRPGRELSETFGKSRQQAFIQLVNDPLFKQGVQ